MYVHVSHPDGETKFWISPELALATCTGLSPKRIKEAQRLVVVHREEITQCLAHPLSKLNYAYFKTQLLATGVPAREPSDFC